MHAGDLKIHVYMSYAAAVANMKAALVHAGKMGKMHVTITC